MRWIVELEPGNYLLGFNIRGPLKMTMDQPDALRFSNVFRAGDMRDLMKKQHGFDGARIVEVES